MNERDSSKLGCAMFIILILGVLCMIMSCSGAKKIVNTEKLVDTTYVTKYQRDSIYLHDSIYNEVYLQGDTIVKYKYVQKTAYKWKEKTDTLYKSVRDTVIQTVEVKEKVSLWDKWRMSLGDLLIILLVLGGIAGIIALKK